jgi:hypothetical protein
MRFWTLFFCFIIFCSVVNTTKAQELNSSNELLPNNFKKISFEQSKSLELLHVLIALTPQNNTIELLNKDSKEYKEVIFFFSRFKHLKIVKTIHRALLRQGYQALALEFIQHNFESTTPSNSKFIHKNFYDIDYFMKESNFSEFITSNAKLFKIDSNTLPLNNPFNSFSDWFKERSQQKYKSYTFIISPLIKRTYLFKPSKKNKLDKVCFITTTSDDKLNFQLFELTVQLYLDQQFNILNKRIVRLVQRHPHKWKSEVSRIEKWKSIQIFNTYLSALLYEIYVAETKRFKLFRRTSKRHRQSYGYQCF